MKAVYGFLGMATLGCAVYHLGQKCLASHVNPLLLLAGVYLIALVLCLLCMPYFQVPSQALSLKVLFSWPVLLTGLGVFLIELGFLLAYRTGGGLQWSGIVVNGLAAVILIPLAVTLFNEKLSLMRLAGIVLTVIGVVLTGKK